MRDEIGSALIIRQGILNFVSIGTIAGNEAITFGHGSAGGPDFVFTSNLFWMS